MLIYETPCEALFSRLAQSRCGNSLRNSWARRCAGAAEALSFVPGWSAGLAPPCTHTAAPPDISSEVRMPQVFAASVLSLQLFFLIAVFTFRCLLIFEEGQCSFIMLVSEG